MSHKILLIGIVFIVLFGGIIWIIIVNNRKGADNRNGNGQPTPPGPTPQPSPESNSISQEFLNRHNKYRQLQLNTQPLSWNNDLANGATQWGNYISQRGACDGSLFHPDTKDLINTYLNNDQWGQNLAWMTNGSPTSAVDGWFNECHYYQPSNPLVGTNNGETGHYTQLMYRDTKEVGCAVTPCPNGSKIFTCDYNPAGNVVDEESNNQWDLIQQNVQKVC